MHSFLIFTIVYALTLANAYVIPFRRNDTGETASSVVTLSVTRPSASPPASVVTVTVTATPTSMTSSTSLPSTTDAPSSSSSTSSVLTTSSLSTPAPSASTIPSSSSQKFVVAHHMVGNTFPYTLQDWIDDVTLAHASGIDGFALNVGSDDFQKAQVSNAYEAASQSGLDFKLFFSLDMTALACASADDAQALRSWVQTYMSHPNQFIYGNKAFVSTFSGESCTFGQSSVTEGWKTQFVQHPDLSNNVFFVPSFFVDPATFSTFKDVMHGDFNWNSAWPVELTTDVANSLLSDTSASLKTLLSTNTLSGLESALTKFIGSTETDQQHLQGLSTLGDGLTSRDESSELVYMASVSPWFFTHYGPDSFNKNFVYLGDQHLYSRRWEALIDSRDKFDIVEINTWNDYGESHYIGPIKGAQPNSEAWTDGMNHTAWLGLTRYYATAFKTGAFPDVDKDQIYMWARPHSVLAEAQADSFEDAVWAVVLATAPATVTLSTSDTNSQTFDVPAGLSKLSISISAGDTMKGVIERDGDAVVELSPESFSFQGSPQTYNFNAFVASASAE
ncbi:hypothetical protein BDZ89DRAFT_1057464 [Hymenopellis radicata]|nr:hypothetical protein BDZ89DRAFT_1057464 [Hymenopellis radicata]